jgi:hypothetical protein
VFTKTKPIEERFWPKVQKTDGCWLWRSPDKRGYGTIWDNARKKNRRATQVSWEIHHGKSFPDGMDACHTCDNPPCVRPDHIFPGTAKDNAQDALRKGRLKNVALPAGWQRTLTHCKRGHEFTPENTYLKKDNNGRRACRACAKLSYAFRNRKRVRK